MDTVKDRKEIKAAGAALQEWFKSQDICPTDAIFVISNLIARQAIHIAESSNDVLDSMLKLKALPDLVQTSVALEIKESFRENLISRLGEIKDPELRALVERLIKK